MQKLAKSKSTLCIFLSIAQVDGVVDSLAESYGRDCPVTVVYKASWSDEMVISGTLDNIASKVN